MVSSELKICRLIRGDLFVQDTGEYTIINIRFMNVQDELHRNMVVVEKRMSFQKR